VIFNPHTSPREETPRWEKGKKVIDIREWLEDFLDRIVRAWIVRWAYTHSNYTALKPVYTLKPEIKPQDLKIENPPSFLDKGPVYFFRDTRNGDNGEPLYLIVDEGHASNSTFQAPHTWLRATGFFIPSNNLLPDDADVVEEMRQRGDFPLIVP
jgi:hypothetical protein